MTVAPELPPTATASEPVAKPTWRSLLTRGLQPRSVGCAVGLGAAIGIAPIPGLQLAAAGFSAWRLGLNLPLVLLASNISFGPLLMVWAAIDASTGRWLRTGVVPWHTYQSFLADLRAADRGWWPFWQAIGTCFGDWLLGSLLLMPLVAVVCGGVAFALAYAAQRLRRQPAPP